MRRKRSMSDGMTVKVQTSEHTTPFAKTIPISAPIFKRMKQSMSSPTTVVSAEESIEDDDALIALFTAMPAVIRSVCSFCS